MCRGGQERAGRRKRGQQREVREKRFLAPSKDGPHPAPFCCPVPPEHDVTLPLSPLSFPAGASKRESSAKEAWEAKGDVSAVLHQSRYFRPILLSRNPCPASLAPPSLSSPPCYCRHTSPLTTSVHSKMKGDCEVDVGLRK
ncbi:hypothetical protein BT69DRAFT_53774 [Atractiella rhizophila]|nr:hypothetical protein BT69DRAFT_53774 [Atractiella rhizophila]